MLIRRLVVFLLVPSLFGLHRELGAGADNDSDVDDSMDEEDVSDMDGEIDLVSEDDEDELEPKKEERPAKRVKVQK